jgi:hypothetical protein
MTINDTNSYIDNELLLKFAWLCDTKISVISKVVVSTVKKSLSSKVSFNRKKDKARKFGNVDTMV